MNTETLKAILGTVRIDKNGKKVEKPIMYEEYLKGHYEPDNNLDFEPLKAYQEATEVIKLVPLSEFVNVFKKESQVNCCEMAGKVINYTDFITQQLTKGQFEELFILDDVVEDFIGRGEPFGINAEIVINNGVTLYLKIRG